MTVSLRTSLNNGLNSGLRESISGGAAGLGTFKAASLDFLFAKKKTLKDRITGKNLITFSRASSATFVDSDGLIKTTPVNSLTYSEDFTQSGWGKQNGTVTATTFDTTSPTGVSSTYTPDTTDSTHGVTWDGSILNVGTFSIYAKSAGYDLIQLRVAGISNNSAAVNFNLTNGLANASVGLSGTSANGTAWTINNYGIESVGNGWYRIHISYNANSGNGKPAFRVVQNFNATDGAGANQFAGDGTSGVMLTGAQFETDSTTAPTDYIKATGAISGAPRFDYDPATGESLGLLIEEERTNYAIKSSSTLLTKSVAETVVTQNAFTAPDGTNTATRVQGSNGYVQIPSSAKASVPAGSTLIASYYIYSVNGIQNLKSRLLYGTGFSDTTFNVPAGRWIRHVSNVRTDDTGSDTSYSFRVLTAMNGASTDVDVYIWGLQVEVGAHATSHIPTSGATKTRTPDIAEIDGFVSLLTQSSDQLITQSGDSLTGIGLDFGDFYNQTEGTFFTHTGVRGVDNNTVADARVILYNGSSSNGHWLEYRNTSNQINARTRVNGASYYGSGQYLSPIDYLNDKVAISYSANGGSAVKGNLVNNTSTAFTSTISALYIGAKHNAQQPLNGHIKRLSYFPTRLPDATLQSITS